jgi:hypothetical protein
MKSKKKIEKGPSVIDRIIAPVLRLMDIISGRHVPAVRPKRGIGRNE